MGNFLFYLILIFALMFCCSYLVKVYAYPGPVHTIVGVTPLKITTESMEPKLSVGTLVFMTDQNSYKPGDIISFFRNGNVITQRVDSIKEDGKIVTKGDNNKVVDINPVASSDVIGKVQFSIPHIPIYILVLIGVGLIAFIWGVGALLKKEEVAKIN
jgi:signal peptidase